MGNTFNDGAPVDADHPKRPPTLAEIPPPMNMLELGRAVHAVRVQQGILIEAAKRKADAEAAVNATSLEPLSDNEKAVLKVIQDQKPDEALLGKQILAMLDADGLTIDEGNFNRIIGRLKKKHGVKNRPNVGYYIP